MPEEMAINYPFLHSDQLTDELDEVKRLAGSTVPGYPRVRLDDSVAMMDFLERDLFSQDLDQISARLWWMAKQDSASISPLHRQKVKEREIVITEDPKLHLIWHYNTIFIKPLPRYLLSYTFWDEYLSPTPDCNGKKQRILKAALGILRSYFYLVQYESDFRIAKDLYLIPSHINWLSFCRFSSKFDLIKDQDVLQRYTYGEIRLTRLNFYAIILLRRWNFHRTRSQYGTYFAQFYAPVLFALGILSVMLSAMQVGVTVEQIEPELTWIRFHRTSQQFSVVCLVFMAILLVILATLFIFKIIKEWIYAIQDRLTKRPSPKRKRRSSVNSRPMEMV